MTFKQPSFNREIASSASLLWKKEDKKPEKEVRLEVLDKKNEKSPEKSEGKKSSLQKYLDYLCLTQGVEVETDRVNKLQKIANDMTAGSEVKVRLVILNKGKNSSAFVMPDGTICVSQSMLNKLDYMDEIAGVIAHEVGHIINKSHKRSLVANPLHQLGVDWIHEAASDQIAADLLRKAGYNSQGLIFAIEKISGYERGFEHQSGVARASEGVIGHFLVDYQTSNKEMTLKSTEFKKGVEKTDYENIQDAIRSLDAKKASRLLPSLHPYDLKKSCEELMRMEDWWFGPSFNLKSDRQKLIDIYFQYFTEKLVKEGIEKEYIELYISYLAQCYPERMYIHPLRNFENLVSIIKKLDYEKDFQKINKIDLLLFDSKEESYYKSKRGQFLDDLRKYIFDRDVYPDKLNGIPLSREQLISLFALIQQKGEKMGSEGRNQQLIMDLLMGYTQSTYLVLAENFEENKDATKEQIFDLWQEVKDMGLNFNAYHSNLGHLVSEGIWEALIIEKNKTKISRSGKEMTAEEWEKIGRTDFLKGCFDEFTGKSIERISEKYIYDFVKQFFADRGEHAKFGAVLTNERLLQDFFELFEKDFKDYNKSELNLSDEERIRLVKILAKEIDGQNFQVRHDFAWILNGMEGSEQNFQQNLEENEKLLKLDWKLNLCAYLFHHDSPDFYQFIEDEITKSGIKPNDLNRIQLINLSRTLLNMGHLYIYDHLGEKRPNEANNNDSVSKNNIGYKFRTNRFFSAGKLEIGMMDKFSDLSIIREIILRNNEMKDENIDQLASLDEKIQSVLDKLISVKRDKNSNSAFDKEDLNEVEYNIFSSEPRSLLLFEKERKYFFDIIGSNLPENKYQELYDFIKKYYPGGKKYLTEIRKTYLKSKEIDLTQKTEYLIKNFDEIGLEGMIMLGEQIKEVGEYKTFREKMGPRLEKYLDGSGVVEVAAVADLASSFVVQEFEKLFATCSTKGKNRQETTEELGELWAQIFLKNEEYYNSENKKFYLNDKSRRFFRSFKDIVEELKNLSQEKRLALVHKALTEKDGALSSEKNRKKLGEILIDSLEIKPGFVAEALKSACLKADAKYITFPIAQMMAKMLFRAYDLEKIDYGRMQNYVENKFSGQEISSIFLSSTDELKEFGDEYKKAPNCELAQWAKQSNMTYENCKERLEKILNMQNKTEAESASETSNSTEAIISACERNPLSVRTLQLLVQLRKFEPTTEKRLAKSLDANEGLNKLLFWENLYRFAEQDTKIKDFVDKVKTVGEKAGGGSLFTTYFATNTDEREIVIKMLNPNAEAFVKASWTMLHDTLDDVIKKNGGGIRKDAQLGNLLIDSSQNWCVTDIGYSGFVKKDNQFRLEIEKINQGLDSKTYNVPEVIFEEVKLKSEERAKGTTVNQFLNNPEINEEKKKELVLKVIYSFMKQIDRENMVEEGKYLVHSDPHIGNYMVEFNQDELGEIGIIDRNMYLEFEQNDIDVLQKFVNGDNYNFITSFANRILDINKNRGMIRQYKYASIMGQVLTDYAQARLRGEEDSFYFFQRIMAKMAENQLDVPLKYRLMIRNIQSFKELAEKYNIDFAQYYE